MKSIAFPIIFHSTTRNSMLKLLKECKKYSVNTYTYVEISLNTCRNTLDFMCELELFSKIRSHMNAKQKQPGCKKSARPIWL